MKCRFVFTNYLTDSYNKYVLATMHPERWLSTGPVRHVSCSLEVFSVAESHTSPTQRNVMKCQSIMGAERNNDVIIEDPNGRGHVKVINSSSRLLVSA